MPETIGIGDEAPNFDLASTEDVVLMLRDEVPRTPVLLFFFEGVEAAKPALESLRDLSAEMMASGVKLMAISATPLDELKEVQRDLHLEFPLLHDDRDLAAAYGAGTALAAEAAAPLVLVGKDQSVLWIGQAPVAPDAIRAAAAAATKTSSTVNYPRKVINRFVGFWAN